MKPALLACLLLAGCTRTVRQQSAVREVATLASAASASSTVETVETRGPSVTVVEEYAPPSQQPERAGDHLKDSNDGGLPSNHPVLVITPGAPPLPVLIRRTTITQGPVVIDTHAAASAATSTHAAQEHDTTATVVTETRAGPPWWLWLVAVVVAGAVAYALGRRVTGGSDTVLTQAPGTDREIPSK